MKSIRKRKANRSPLEINDDLYKTGPSITQNTNSANSTAILLAFREREPDSSFNRLLFFFVQRRT
ncbi:hypothetical protein [Tenacibaculum aiptasiae]|uniref:hypothetical protein n=1 Tax=Tenacibaculum aiptasiae TaxID=426481 RepID=UPI00233144B3|nr:hypothetical protein [Tenacibaculum aiptasiae]